MRDVYGGTLKSRNGSRDGGCIREGIETAGQCTSLSVCWPATGIHLVVFTKAQSMIKPTHHLEGWMTHTHTGSFQLDGEAAESTWVKHLMPVTYTMVYSHSISQPHDSHMTSGEFYIALNNANSWCMHTLVKSPPTLLMGQGSRGVWSSCNGGRHSCGKVLQPSTLKLNTEQANKMRCLTITNSAEKQTMP